MRRIFRPGLAFILAALAVILALAASSARAAVVTKPWNLAVVLDLSESMGAPWLGSSRAMVAERHLGLELRTMPLRVTVGLWAAVDGKAVVLLPPQPASKLKGVRLRLPRPTGRGGMAAALEQASLWLKKSGGGSILLITGNQAPVLSPVFFKQLDKLGGFLHIFAIAPGQAEKKLQALVTKGGGLSFANARPADVARLLRRAVIAALSPSLIDVLAYDQANQPLHLNYALQRRDQAWGLVSGQAHRRLQIPAGVYLLTWPQGPPPKTPSTPANVTVPPQGLLKLWQGGKSKLVIKGQASEGKPLTWKIKVSRVDDGRLLTPYSKLPITLSPAGGRYLIRSMKPAHQWIVELGAGDEVQMTVGPPGRLLAGLAGPLGAVRLPYFVIDERAHRRVATGYTNSKLTLLPGVYRLELQMHPSKVKKLIMEPGQEVKLDLGKVGVLHVLRAKQPGPLRFRVETPHGRKVAAGVGERRIVLGAGSYVVHFGGNLPSAEVDIKDGELTTLDPVLAPIR